MTSYIVAGSAKNKQLSEVENLCTRLKGVYRDIGFKIISKHEKDWENYITQICKIYGFKDKLDPICFTP